MMISHLLKRIICCTAYAGTSLSSTIRPKSFIHTSLINGKGHSKWQNIQHIKADVDQARANKIKQQMQRIRIAITGML